MAEELTAAKIPNWTKWVTDFDATHKLYSDNFNALVRLQPWVKAKHPELLTEHMRILKRFEDQRPTVIKMKEVRDGVVNWLHAVGATIQGALNFTGVQAGMDWLKERFGLNGLGIAPVFVVVGIASATAALITIAALVKEAYVYSQRLNALKELEERGSTPQEAAAIVNSVLGKPGTNMGGAFLGIPFNTIALTAAAVFLGPPLIGMIAGPRK